MLWMTHLTIWHLVVNEASSSKIMFDDWIKTWFRLCKEWQHKYWVLIQFNNWGVCLKEFSVLCCERERGCPRSSALNRINRHYYFSWMPKNICRVERARASERGWMDQTMWKYFPNAQVALVKHWLTKNTLNSLLNWWTGFEGDKWTTEVSNNCSQFNKINTNYDE